MMDKTDKPDITDPMLATESTEATDPAEPIDRMEPAEPMDSTEPVEPIDRIDPVDPMLSSDPAEPAESRLTAMIAFSQHGHRPARAVCPAEPPAAVRDRQRQAVPGGDLDSRA